MAVRILQLSIGRRNLGELDHDLVGERGSGGLPSGKIPGTSQLGLHLIEAIGILNGVAKHLERETDDAVVNRKPRAAAGAHSIRGSACRRSRVEKFIEIVVKSTTVAVGLPE